MAFSKPLIEQQCLHAIVFKIYCFHTLMHCSDFFFIVSIICKGEMALGTCVEAAMKKYSAKVGLGSSIISRMELFVRLYDCHKELLLKCCRDPWSDWGYKLSFCIDHHINFPCLQIKLCHYFILRFVEVCPSVIFFSEKLINDYSSLKAPFFSCKQYILHSPYLKLTYSKSTKETLE